MKDALIAMGVVVGGVLGVIFGILILVFVGALLMAWPLMWCWNYVLPVLWDIQVITYWQAFCLYVLAGLLIKGGSSSSSSTK